MNKILLTLKNALIIIGFLVLISLVIYFYFFSHKKIIKKPIFVGLITSSTAIVNDSNFSTIGTNTINVKKVEEIRPPADKRVIVSKPLNFISTTTTMKSNLNVTTTAVNNITIPTVAKMPSEVMAWIYPGNPTCEAKNEYSDGRKINILKPEYFTINEEGQLILLTEKSSGCNGYSISNVASLKKYSTQQYVTVSSSYAVSMKLFLDNSTNDLNNINTLVSFVTDNNLTGIEIDFEDFGGWDKETYIKYKQFLSKLGDALHIKNKKLMIDGPATSNSVEDSWYAWKYSDFNSLPVDKIVVMTYDYQYDQGSGRPVSPVSWIISTINWTLKKINDKSKISFGIPSYGYKSVVGTNKFSLLTYDQIKKEPGFDTAVRDPESFEMTWRSGSNIYFYQDSESMSKKLQAIESSGVKSVSVWHLGGSPLFNK